MRGRFMILVLAALAVGAACRRSSSESKRGQPDASAAAVAPSVEQPPAARTPESAPTAPAPDAAAVSEAGPPPVTPPAPDASGHCAEPPERVQARENIARMQEEHRLLAGQLDPIRDAFLASAGQFIEQRPWEAVRETAKQFAAQASAVPGWHEVPVDVPEQALRQAAVLLVACRSLREDPGACDSADGIEPDGGRDCRTLSRALNMLHRVGQGERSPSGATPGSPDDPAAARLAADRAAAWGGDAAACARLQQGAGEESEWVATLCQAAVAGDLAPCDALTRPGLRPVCRALAARVLAAQGHPGPAPDEAEAATLQRLDRLATGDGCAATVRELLAADPAVQAVFSAGALVVPDIERERGLIEP